MQALHDIFAIWTDLRSMATALNEKKDTVYRWHRRGRIPDTAWQRVIKAAEVRGRQLTVADLHAANRPAKPRGRANHKIRSIRRRSEPRAIS